MSGCFHTFFSANSQRPFWMPVVIQPLEAVTERAGEVGANSYFLLIYNTQQGPAHFYALHNIYIIYILHHPAVSVSAVRNPHKSTLGTHQHRSPPRSRIQRRVSTRGTLHKCRQNCKTEQIFRTQQGSYFGWNGGLVVAQFVQRGLHSTNHLNWRGKNGQKSQPLGTLRHSADKVAFCRRKYLRKDLRYFWYNANIIVNIYGISIQ